MLLLLRFYKASDNWSKNAILLHMEKHAHITRDIMKRFANAATPSNYLGRITVFNVDKQST